MKHLYILVIFIFSAWACKKDSDTNPPIQIQITDGSSSQHLLLGNPTNATNDPKKEGNYLLVKDQYVTAYNVSYGGSIWTAWHLGKSDLGTAVRKDDFRPDESLPDNIYKVKPSDYTSEYGFDRGHMCPSADRTKSSTDNSSTFLMSNIVPQAPELNRGVWEEFEAFCREQVYEGNELYIYAGSYGLFGTGSKGTFREIANGRILVPSNYYKVVLILPEGNNDLARIDENTKIIAIDVPNNQGVKNKDWEDYITYISAIEGAAKLKLWPKIPEGIYNKLKYKKYSTSSTTTPPNSSTSTPSTGCGTYNGKSLYRGPQGGCYYINSKGNKTYVDRSYCRC